MKRRHMSRKASKKTYSRTARPNKKNMAVTPERGGFRA